MNQDQVNRLVDVLQKQNEYMMDLFSSERRQYTIKRMSTSEIEGIYYCGSKLGKKWLKPNSNAGELISVTSLKNYLIYEPI